MSPIKIGVAGLGWVAGAHIETFKKFKDAQVTAVYSRRPLDPAVLERKFGIPIKVYNDYQQMLMDPEIEIVDICTPHPLHPEQAIAAAKMGKHLIIEKPIAIDYLSALQVRRAIESAGVQAMVCFEVRFSRQVMAIKETIERGLIGTVHYGECDYYHGIGPWYGQYAWNIKKSMGASSMLTAGCHAVDLLLHYMDGEVEEVMSYQTGSKSKHFKPYEYNTTSVAILKFRDGRVGKVASVTDCLQPYYFHMHLVGSEGSVLDDKFTSMKWAGMYKDRWANFGVPVVDSGDVSDHPYQPQFRSFLDALAKKKAMPYTDFNTAFESHRVVFAADKSAAEGRPVKLSELAV
jgi:predicted dehydrogenase